MSGLISSLKYYTNQLYLIIYTFTQITGACVHAHARTHPPTYNVPVCHQSKFQETLALLRLHNLL